ncbi:MAG: putative quinol monooxygenase [Paracoccaceae bacterium]
MILVTGTVTCTTPADLAVIEAYLPDHIALSRAEPGCLRFDIVQSGPMEWQLDEAFVDQAAFVAHQVRTKASVWGEMSKNLSRDFKIIED